MSLCKKIEPTKKSSNFAREASVATWLIIGRFHTLWNLILNILFTQNIKNLNKGEHMSQALQVAIGAGMGYNFSLATEKEAEARQGENYYLSSLGLARQIAQLASIVRTLSKAIPNSFIRSGAQITAAGASLTSFAACPLFAAVKQGHYEGGMTFVKPVLQSNSPTIANFLPDKLSEDTENLFSYLAENLSSINKISMLVATMSLPFVGSPYLAAGVAFPLVYQFADSHGVVPRSLSLMMETHMPMIANGGALLGGGPVAQALAALQILSYSPTFNQFLQQKIEKQVKTYMDLPGPSMEDIDAPLIVNKQLSFEQINAILAVDEDSKPPLGMDRAIKFRVNPAHCSKPVWALKNLPKDFEFSKFLELFKTIKWEEKYTLLKKPFSQDNRFIAYLKSQFPGQKDVRERFEYYLDLHAKRMETTKEVFLADQLEKQMIALVKLLKGERRGEGSQKDVDEAIHYSAQILANISKLNLDNPLDRVTFEDLFVKLGIEAGEYCPLGVKRASKEIVRGILQQLSEDDDPVKDYERQLQQALETARTNLVDASYKQFVSLIPLAMQGKFREINGEIIDEQAVAIAEDVHSRDTYYKPFAFGVVPLSDYERNSMGVSDFMLWGSPAYPFRGFRQEIYNKYYNAIHDVIHEIGHIYFANYMRTVIAQNFLLNETQKEEIIEKLTECNDGAWSVESTQNRFNRLACVMLGALTFETISDDWAEVDSNDLPPAKVEVVENNASGEDYVLV